MHVYIGMTFNLKTMKRTSRAVEVYDPRDGAAIDSELPKRLLLPTKLPQEWLPAELRSGASLPVRSWTDRSLFVLDEADDAPQNVVDLRQAEQP